MEFEKIQYKKAKIDSKIDYKINTKIISISDKLVNIRKYYRDSNRNDFSFQYLR